MCLGILHICLQECSRAHLTHMITVLANRHTEGLVNYSNTLARAVHLL
jgi:hypothetical protein